MIRIIILFIFANFHQCFTLPRNCTKQDYCRPVPARICDNTFCQPFHANDFIAFGKAGIKEYTSTIAQKPFVGYCPLLFEPVLTKLYNGKTQIPTKLILNSGPSCDSTETSSRLFVGEPDAHTGLFSVISVELDGETYEACMPYFEPGEALVFRLCKVNPSPPPGEACASLIAWESEDGNCNRKKLRHFLQELDIDFAQLEVDCI